MPRRLPPPWLALLLLLPGGCGEPSPATPPEPAPGAVDGSARASASSASATAPSSISSGGTAAPRPPRPRPPSSREGETSAEALFERARAALADGNDLELVRCLEPGARRAWLADALLAIEVEVQVPRYEDAIARRRALGALRQRVVAHLRDDGPAPRPRDLSAEVVGEALLDRVDAPDQLLAELLGVARGLGHPLDPVSAATLGRAPSANAPPSLSAPPMAGPGGPPPVASGAGLGRALRRIERSVDLAEVHLVDDRGIALVRDADGGLEPVRLVRRGDTVWIDES